MDEGDGCWRETLVPELSRHGIEFLDPSRLTGETATWMAEYYRDKVSPVLTRSRWIQHIHFLSRSTNP